MLLWKAGVCRCLLCGECADWGRKNILWKQFMEQLRQGNKEAEQKNGQEYLDHLAILISNLRMAYDMDIILGGRCRRCIWQSI